MPKETVSNDGSYATKIGWSNTDGGGYIQLGVEVADGDLFTQLLSSYADRIGQMVRYTVETETTGINLDKLIGEYVVKELASIGEYKGIWATLDREDCNRLIKILRRARDASFGRDE